MGKGICVEDCGKKWKNVEKPRPGTVRRVTPGVLKFTKKISNGLYFWRLVFLPPGGAYNL